MPAHQTSPPTFSWHSSQWAHCAQCIMELLNRLFYPGNWSHCCQGVNWDSIHSQPTDRFWIVAANSVGWSGRHQKRSRESLCVCVDLWLYMNDSSEEHAWNHYFKGKRRGRGDILNIRSGTWVRIRRKVSPKSLGNFCAQVQLHSQAVLW